MIFVCLSVILMGSEAYAAVLKNPLLVRPEIMENNAEEEIISLKDTDPFYKTESNYNSCVLIDNETCFVRLVDAGFDKENGWEIAVRCENRGEEDLCLSWNNKMVIGEDSIELWEDDTVVSPGKMRQLGILTSEAEEAEYFEFSVSVIKGDEIISEASAIIKPAYGHAYILSEECSPIIVDFDGLLERNNEVCGWLYSPGTVISYPVVQTENNSKYLHKDIDLNYSSYGMIFAEANSEQNFNNDNNVLYGHHMNDGSMFASIVNYARQNYYEKHPVIYLNTPEINYRVDIFAAFLTDMYSDVYIPNFLTDKEMQTWLDAAAEQSAIETDVTVVPGDKILTMSTCTYEYDTARYVVLGKMTPIL